MVKREQHPTPELRGGSMVTSEDSLRRGGEALNNYRHPPHVETPFTAIFEGSVFRELKRVDLAGYGVGVETLVHCYPFWGLPVVLGSKSISSGLPGRMCTA